MNPGKRLQRQVSPRTTAVVILLALAAVQAAWWRGLVWRPPAKGGPPPPMGGMTGGPPTVSGRKDVRVDTLAGTPEPGDADGLGRNARFDSPAGIALDSGGNLYIADCLNDRIRRLDAAGRVTTVAGSVRGYADGPAASARFNMPCGVAVGPDGVVYVADTGNHRIRQIREGVVTTLAGGARGDADGAGASVRFDQPCAVDYRPGPPATLLVADSRNRRIRVLGLDGRTLGGWRLAGAPVAIGLEPPTAAVPQAGALAGPTGSVSDIAIDTVQIEGPHRAEDYALRGPTALCRVRDGWIVADRKHCAVFLVAGKSAEVLAGIVAPNAPLPGWRDGAGDRCGFGLIGGLATDGKGHIYVSDTTNHSIRRITLAEALPPGEEVSTESRDQRTDEGLRRWYLRDTGDRPRDHGRDLRAPGP
jgi:hypothetical protein